MFVEKGLAGVAVSFHINELILERILPSVIYVEEDLLRMDIFTNIKKEFIQDGGLEFMMYEDNEIVLKFS